MTHLISSPFSLAVKETWFVLGGLYSRLSLTCLFESPVKGMGIDKVVFFYVCEEP